MIYELHLFNPETFKKDGFRLVGSFESIDECHAKALNDSISFYRIEEKSESFSRKVFMSELPKPPEPEVIPEPLPEPIPEVVQEPEQPPIEE